MRAIQEVQEIELASVVAGIGGLDALKRLGPRALTWLRNGQCIGKASVAGAIAGSATTAGEVVATGTSKWSPSISPFTGSAAAWLVGSACKP